MPCVLNRDSGRFVTTIIPCVPLRAREPSNEIDPVIDFTVSHVSVDQLALHRMLKIGIPATLCFNHCREPLEFFRLIPPKGNVNQNVSILALPPTHSRAYLNFPIDYDPPVP